MTKLPAKNLLDGSKLPKTTTGEMKDALGKLRDYLHELLGEDSADKEAARLALGIDLAELGAQIETRAARTELETRARELEEEIIKRGVPVGSIDWLAVTTPPAGYLKADGSAVGRQTYPDLFAAIGTTFGEGDGETTFKLPNLMERFAEGSATPGTVKEAGLPNIAGYSDAVGFSDTSISPTGAFSGNTEWLMTLQAVEKAGTAGANVINFDASRSNPIYGASDTVQPPALTLLPCIKAFDAAVNEGLVDTTQLAQEVANKADKTQVATLALPSSQMVALTAPQNPTQYTAPADGYFYSLAYANPNGGHINLINDTSGMGSMVPVFPNGAAKAWLPARKGDIVNMEYSNLLENTSICFIYAEGSQP